MHESEMDCPIIVTTPHKKLLLGKGVDAHLPLENEEVLYYCVCVCACVCDVMCVFVCVCVCLCVCE
jgi:hypothetical protein